MIFEICAIVATLLLIILTVYIVQTLREVRRSVNHTNKILCHLEPELAVLQVDLKKLLNSSTELVQKINDKISDIDPLFQTIHHAGNALNSRVHAFKKDSYRFEEEIDKTNISERILDIIELTKAGIQLYQQIKKRK